MRLIKDLPAIFMSSNNKRAIEEQTLSVGTHICQINKNTDFSYRFLASSDGKTWYRYESVEEPLTEKYNKHE